MDLWKRRRSNPRYVNPRFHGFRILRERTQRLVSTLPSQVEYLSHVRAKAGAPVVGSVEL